MMIIMAILGMVLGIVMYVGYQVSLFMSCLLVGMAVSLLIVSIKCGKNSVSFRGKKGIYNVVFIVIALIAIYSFGLQPYQQLRIEYRDELLQVACSNLGVSMYRSIAMPTNIDGQAELGANKIFINLFSQNVDGVVIHELLHMYIKQIGLYKKLNTRQSELLTEQTACFYMGREMNKQYLFKYGGWDGIKKDNLDKLALRLSREFDDVVNSPNFQIPQDRIWK